MDEKASNKNLKESGIFISEQLSRETGALFFQRRQIKKNKINAGWTYELKITINTKIT